MTEQKSPSQEEPKGGVFDSIRGARSRDPEAVEEPKAAPETTEQEQPTQAAGEPAKRGDERLTQASQRIARLERQLNDLGPWAQFGMAVGTDGKGKALVEKYQRGEPLFSADDSEAIAAEDSIRASQGEPPMTRSELANFMDQRDAAKTLATEINSMASEELPEFKKLSRNPKYAEMLDYARQSVWRGTTPMDESVLGWQNDYAAKEMTAVRKAYRMLLADDPKVLEAAKKAGVSQQRERDAELAAVSSSTGTTTTSQEEPGEKSEAEKLIEGMINPRGRGKSFSSIR